MSHNIERAVNIDYLAPGFAVAMQKAWSRETCWEGCVADYRDDNPSFGNCLVTVLAAWADEGFTDHVQPLLVQANVHPPARPAWHFKLVRPRHGLYEYDIDPTWQQFPPGSCSENVFRYGQTHGIHFNMVYGSFFEPEARQSLERRLSLFIQRLQTEGGYNLVYGARQILERLDNKFSFILEQARERGLPVLSQNAGGSVIAPAEPLITGP